MCVCGGGFGPISCLDHGVVVSLYEKNERQKEKYTTDAGVSDSRVSVEDV